MRPGYNLSVEDLAETKYICGHRKQSSQCLKQLAGLHVCTETGRRIGGTSAGYARHHVLDLKLCNTEEDTSVCSLRAETKYFGLHILKKCESIALFP